MAISRSNTFPLDWDNFKNIPLVRNLMDSNAQTI